MRLLSRSKISLGFDNAASMRIMQPITERQVWAPILGSALTTVIVFIGLMLDLPVGQLFRDIGIAISVSVLISVVVSVTVIPTLSARLPDIGPILEITHRYLLSIIAQRLAGFFTSYAALVVRRKKTGAGIVAALLAFGVFASVALMRRNLIIFLMGMQTLCLGGLVCQPAIQWMKPCGLPNGWKRLLGPCGRARLLRDRLSTVSFSLLIPVALLPAHRLSIGTR